MGIFSFFKREWSEIQLQRLYKQFATHCGAKQERVEFLASATLALVDQNINSAEKQTLLNTLYRQIKLLAHEIGRDDIRIRALIEMHGRASDIIASKSSATKAEFAEHELNLAAKGKVMPLVERAAYFTSPIFVEKSRLVSLRDTRAVPALLDVLEEGTYRIPAAIILSLIEEPSVIPYLLKGISDSNKDFRDLCAELLKRFRPEDIESVRTKLQKGS